jgi:hypothetical protein
MNPDRIAIDAQGYGWRVWDGEDSWSMVPTNPDNSPIPEPVTWYLPERIVTPRSQQHDSGRCDCTVTTSPLNDADRCAAIEAWLSDVCENPWWDCAAMARDLSARLAGPELGLT